MRRNKRFAYGMVSLFAFTILLFLLNICIGSVSISIKDVFASITGSRDTTTYGILWNIRLPRTIADLVLGGALALSGYLLQTFFHNPIAGPFILGISSGSKLMVALALIVTANRIYFLSSTILIGAAFIGAMVVMLFVLAMSKKMRGMSMLIISGVMVGYICSAITDLLVTFAEDSDIVNLHNWSKGSFSGISWENIVVMCLLVCICAGLTFLLSKPISAYEMGEEYATSVGVNVRFLRVALILLSSFLSACVVAFAGPISFVGVAVPHLIKGILKTEQPIYLIPACFVGGSVFCLWSDLLARMLFSPTELSISTVTAIFGAPVVLAVMWKRKKETIR